MTVFKTYKVVHYVELGYADGNGVGYWDHTKESVACDSKEAAFDLQCQWRKDGKIEMMHWGELRPTYSYGLYRIRIAEELVDEQNL